MDKEILAKTIILVRHGESDYNSKGIIQGNTNKSVLTAKGKKQANYVGSWLKELSIDKIFSSPLKRAKQTAEIIAKNCDFNPNQLAFDNRLKEIDFGAWKEQNRTVVKQNFPEKYKIWRTRPYDFEIDGNFPVQELYARIEDFINDEIYARDEIRTCIIVGHRGTISSIINCILKLPKSHHHFLQIDRGSVSVLQKRQSESSSGEYELTFANEIPNLDNNSIVDFKTEERTTSHGELFLVRHGQTSSNINREYQGSKDIPLSQLGITNMNSLATSFSPKLPTRIICSPLSRAVESANILATIHKVKSVSIRRDLHELLYGIWEGMTEEEVKTMRYVEYARWQSSPENVEIPKAEHLLDAYNRCSNVWDKYQQDLKFWGGSIISVAHDIVNRLIICNALDLPAKYIWSFKQTNASVSVLAVKEIYDGRLRMLNHSSNPIKSRLSNEWL